MFLQMFCPVLSISSIPMFYDLLNTTTILTKGESDIRMIGAEMFLWCCMCFFGKEALSVLTVLVSTDRCAHACVQLLEVKVVLTNWWNKEAQGSRKPLEKERLRPFALLLFFSLGKCAARSCHKIQTFHETCPKRGTGSLYQPLS